MNRRDFEAMTLRQGGERIAVAAAIGLAARALVQSRLAQDDDAHQRALEELLDAANAMYELGLFHISEQLRLKLDMPVGQDFVVTPLPDECIDGPHAHVRFKALDEDERSPAEQALRDLSN